MDDYFDKPIFRMNLAWKPQHPQAVLNQFISQANWAVSWAGGASVAVMTTVPSNRTGVIEIEPRSCQTPLSTLFSLSKKRVPLQFWNWKEFIFFSTSIFHFLTNGMQWNVWDIPGRERRAPRHTRDAAVRGRGAWGERQNVSNGFHLFQSLIIFVYHSYIHIPSFLFIVVDFCSYDCLERRIRTRFNLLLGVYLLWSGWSWTTMPHY